MRRTIASLILLAITSSSVAGVKSLTMNSRANCGNNETISWHLGHRYMLWTASDHLDKRTGVNIHTVVANWDKTWRSAAVHWGEGRGDWAVMGHHWMADNNGNITKIAEEYTTNCSIYDGWWDH